MGRVSFISPFYVRTPSAYLGIDRSRGGRGSSRLLAELARILVVAKYDGMHGHRLRRTLSALDYIGDQIMIGRQIAPGIGVGGSTGKHECLTAPTAIVVGLLGTATARL